MVHFFVHAVLNFKKKKIYIMFYSIRMWYWKMYILQCTRISYFYISILKLNVLLTINIFTRMNMYYFLNLKN
jgi:hypothetical protein